MSSRIGKITSISRIHSDSNIVRLQSFRDLTYKKSAYLKQIMLVEHDSHLGKALQRLLAEEGYEVILVEDALEFSQKVTFSCSDLILMSANLPWIDGFELLDIIKKYPRYEKIPVIFLTHSMNADLDKALGYGVSDIIITPFQIEHLLSTVKKHINRDSI